MSDATCKTCRRAGAKLFLKGDKCFSPKCIFEKRPTPPGKPLSERKHRTSLTEYGIQLREKQKIRNVYGVTESQFRRYVKEATSAKGGSPVERLYESLERRLDNVVYRLGLAKSRAQARQIVSHGHIVIGKRKLTIPSYSVRDKVTLKLRDGSRTSTYFVGAEKMIADRSIPAWISADAKKLEATVVGTPKFDRNEMGFNFQSVIEFYSR